MIDRCQSKIRQYSVALFNIIVNDCVQQSKRKKQNKMEIITTTQDIIIVSR